LVPVDPTPLGHQSAHRTSVFLLLTCPLGFSSWQAMANKMPFVSPMSRSIFLTVLPVAWSLQAAHVQRLGNLDVGQPSKNKIIMMMSRGCSGSSFIYKQFYDLMEKHGYNVWSPEKEFITSKAEPNISTWSYCTELDGTVHHWPVDPVARLQAAKDVMDEKLTCKEFNVSAPNIFFFDGHLKDDMLKVLPYLAGVGHDNVKVFGVNRANLLERQICMVKDCFPRQDNSYAVYANGTRSSLCLDRRFVEEEVKVYFNPSAIEYHLKHDLPVWEIEDLKADLTRNGFTEFPRATYENLTRYEFDGSQEALVQSAMQFYAVLYEIGITPDLGQIMGHLSKTGRGNFSNPDLTTEIYNLKEVQAALAGTPWRI